MFILEPVCPVRLCGHASWNLTEGLRIFDLRKVTLYISMHSIASRNVETTRTDIRCNEEVQARVFIVQTL